MNVTAIAQLLQLIPEQKFNQLCEQWQIDKYSRRLPTKALLNALVVNFILGGNQSLRDIELSFGIKRSTLSDALASRPQGFFEALCDAIVDVICELSSRRKIQRRFSKQIFAVDATTCRVPSSLRRFPGYKDGQYASVKGHVIWDIDQAVAKDFLITPGKAHDGRVAHTMKFEKGRTYVFDRAYFDLSLWMKITQRSAHFVTRIKKHGQRLDLLHAKYLADIPKNQVGVIFDGSYSISETQSYRYGLKPGALEFRHILYRDPLTGKLFDFITSDWECSAQEVADIYKKRWSVELCFKWLKSHLSLRQFAIRNRNAVGVLFCVQVLVHNLLRLYLLVSEQLKTTWQLLRELRTSFQRFIFETTASHAFPADAALKTATGNDFPRL